MDSLRGLTIIELLVVLSLVGLISATSCVYSLSAYRSVLSRIDAATLEQALRHTQSRAIHHQCVTAGCAAPATFGLHVGSSSAVIYAGISYGGRAQDSDLSIPYAGSELVHTDTDIQFDQAGVHDSTSTISLYDTASSTWTITSTGQTITTSHAQIP